MSGTNYNNSSQMKYDDIRFDKDFMKDYYIGEQSLFDDVNEFSKRHYSEFIDVKYENKHFQKLKGKNTKDCIDVTIDHVENKNGMYVLTKVRIVLFIICLLYIIGLIVMYYVNYTISAYTIKQLLGIRLPIGMWDLININDVYSNIQIGALTEVQLFFIILHRIISIKVLEIALKHKNGVISSGKSILLQTYYFIKHGRNKPRY